MNVSGAAVIVAGHDTVKDGDTVGVGGLHTTESRELQDGGIVRVTHAGIALDSAIDAGRIGRPNIDVSVGNDLAGLVVDDLDGERHLDARLVLADVLANFLAPDVFAELA